jgi:hypothetical protein
VKGGKFGLRPNNFRLRWYDPVATDTAFHQPHDHSEFGLTSRRRPPSSPTYTRSFSPLTSFCEHTKDIFPPLIYTLCLKSVGSWSLLVMVLAERSVLLPASTWARGGRVPWCAKTDMLTEPRRCAGI